MKAHLKVFLITLYLMRQLTLQKILSFEISSQINQSIIHEQKLQILSSYSRKNNAIN